MNEIYAEINLISNKKELKKKLLVDTGAAYSWISGKVLKSLGVRPLGEENFETIEGRIVKRKIGEVLVEYMDQRRHTIVVFAEKKDSEVLGLYTLEGFGLEIDLRNRKLKKSKTLKAL